MLEQSDVPFWHRNQWLAARAGHRGCAQARPGIAAGVIHGDYSQRREQVLDAANAAYPPLRAVPAAWAQLPASTIPMKRRLATGWTAACWMQAPRYSQALG